MQDTVGSIFEGEANPAMRVIKVVPTFLGRDFSVPATSTLRPAYAQKRARETVDRHATKRRRTEQSVGALEREGLDAARDQPVLSTESSSASSRGHNRNGRSLTEASIVLVNSAQTGRSEYAPAVKEESPELGSPPPFRPTTHLRPVSPRENSAARRSLSTAPSRGHAGPAQAVADSQPGPEARGMGGEVNRAMFDHGHGAFEIADTGTEHVPESDAQQLQSTSAQRPRPTPPAKRRNVYDVPSSPEFLSNDTRITKMTYKRRAPGEGPEISLLNTTRQRTPSKAALSPSAKPGSLKKPTDARRLFHGAKSTGLVQTAPESRVESLTRATDRAPTSPLQRSQSKQPPRGCSRKDSTPASTITPRRGRPCNIATRPATLRPQDASTACKLRRPGRSPASASGSATKTPSRTESRVISVSPAESFLKRHSTIEECSTRATNARCGNSSSDQCDDEKGCREPLVAAASDMTGVDYELRKQNEHGVKTASGPKPDAAELAAVATSPSNIDTTTRRAEDDESHSAPPIAEVPSSDLQAVSTWPDVPSQERTSHDGTADMPWNPQSWDFGTIPIPNGDRERTQVIEPAKLPSSVVVRASERPASDAAPAPNATSRSPSASGVVSTRSSPVALRQPARFLSQSPSTERAQSDGGSREPSLAHSASASPRPASREPATDSGSSSSSEESSVEDDNENSGTQPHVPSDEQATKRSTSSYQIASSPPTFHDVPATTTSFPTTSQHVLSQHVRKTPIPLPSNVSRSPRASQSASIRTAGRRSGVRHAGFPTLSQLLVDAQTPVNSSQKKAYDPRTASLTKLVVKKKGNPTKDVRVADDDTSEEESSSDSDSE
jgi:hypothetical protein